jgi:serine/threonine protein phosphatase 1
MDFDTFEDNMVQYRYKVLRPMQIMETNCCSYARWKNYLIEKMSLYAEIEVNGQKYWFVHADCNPEQPLAKQSSKILLWGRALAKYPGLHQETQIIVLGHTPVQALHLGSKPQWLNQGKVVLMDTGSFLENGHISCANLLTKEVWQSD